MIGPVTAPRSSETASLFVEDSQKHGGQIILGGRRIYGKEGYFFEPTFLGDYYPETLITRLEVFSPICALYKFEIENDATVAANDTNMGFLYEEYQSHLEAVRES